MFQKSGGVIKYVGVGDYLRKLQELGERVLRKHLPAQAEEVIAARIARDGEGHAHVTVVGPKELNAMKKAGTAPSDADLMGWVVGAPMALGVGVAVAEDGHKSYFIVLRWGEGHGLRDRLGLARNGQDFHITLGFEGRDVHGVPKDVVQWRLESEQQAWRRAMQADNLRRALRFEEEAAALPEGDTRREIKLQLAADERRYVANWQRDIDQVEAGRVSHDD